MDVRFRPLNWTGPVTPDSKRRSRYTFKAGWQQTLDLLETELSHLKATDIVIEADLAESDIRLDGWPRSGAAPKFPGVRIAFESVHGPLIYSTDTCEFWQHNLRSIALGLEALRAVDRYGVTKRGEQYTGWKALPAGSSPAEPQPMTREDAITTVLRLAKWSTGDPLNRAALISKTSDIRKSIVARATRMVHTDQGGTSEQQDQLREALTVLGLS